MKNIVAELVEKHGMRYEDIAYKVGSSHAAVWKWHKKVMTKKPIYLRKLTRMLERLEERNGK